VQDCSNLIFPYKQFTMRILPFRRCGGSIPLRAILLLSLLLAGCSTSTPYQRIGNRRKGGYSSTRNSNDSYSVTFTGRENSDPEQAYDYALLRSAELTLECHYAYFLVTSDNDRSREHFRYTPGTPGYSTTNFRTSPVTGGIYTYSSYSPGMPGNSYQVKTPVFTLTIKMYQEKSTIKGPDSQIFDAVKLIPQIKAKYKLK
jgi:hypothetical protein